jgi:hypothetical protein
MKTKLSITILWPTDVICGAYIYLPTYTHHPPIFSKIARAIATIGMQHGDCTILLGISTTKAFLIDI